MKKNAFEKLALVTAVNLAVVATAPSIIAKEKGIEELIITGSRAQPRSVYDSVAPIDVISAENFTNQGDTDISTLLRNVVPSYNVNTQPISDAATLVRPANMRGLAPDHTLVLVNSKRRHRASVIYWLGNGVSDGAQGPDISPIPASALKQVEVLRDGAAAQYGSDAIAGVINFILKDDNEGGSLEFKTGQYYEGDGQLYSIAGNIGLPLSENGFANFSFEYGGSDATNRSVQRDDAQELVDAGNSFVNDPAQVWGQPKISDDLKLFANLGLELGDNKEAYAFGNFAKKEVDGGFYFRNPNTRSAVFATTNENNEAIRLVADLTPDNTGNCPTLLIPDASAADYEDQLAADNAALAELSANPDCFVFNELFPGGFTPRFGGTMTDIAGTAGVRQTSDNGWNWDVSVSAGLNDADFFIANTVNASLGAATPTTFDPGKYTQLDQSFNIDLSKLYDVGLASDLNFATGFEWRRESFTITAGDPESFEIGVLAGQGFSAASNGFPGFSPLAAGRWGRSNIAAYADVEVNVVENWLVAAAVRAEDFEDFGTTTNTKLATNFKINDIASLRASYSTGFRAPTPGQSNAFNVSTQFDFTINDLVNNGTIPSTNPVAELRGGIPLDAEKSVNYTAGIVFQLGAFNITMDYFNIELSDRLAISQNFSLTDDEITDLIASGVSNAANLQNFRFFTNDFDTTTQGFDIVASWGTELWGGNSDFSLAYNSTQTTVDSFTPEIIDEGRIKQLEEGLPQTRWNISNFYSLGAFSLMTRLSYYDEFYDSEDGQTYGGEYIVDLEGTYTISDHYSVSLGAQNILDEYPDENPAAAGGVGNLYSQFSPSGFGGGFYYARVKYQF